MELIKSRQWSTGYRIDIETPDGEESEYFIKVGISILEWVATAHTLLTCDIRSSTANEALRWQEASTSR